MLWNSDDVLHILWMLANKAGVTEDGPDHAAEVVEPAGESAHSPSIERLQGRRLLYLGQSGGTTVLYDATSSRAVYMPTSSVVLHVADCDVRPSREPPCAVTGSQ
jgi:hypothetical protein